MSEADLAALKRRNPQAAAALEYEHAPLAEQLDAGMRKLELDVFCEGEGRFTVGHVQRIDMNSHCASLRGCLEQILTWSDAHPDHAPIWIGFNAKDQVIEGLPDPRPFDARSFDEMDAVLREALGGRLILPAQVIQESGPRWPRLRDARGKFILVLDEAGRKRQLYHANWQARPMFTTVAEGTPGAAVLVLNDPLQQAERITRAVRSGYLVRTRADADTVEARTNDTRRRDAAFASGAHAVSTDYYQPARHFGTDYQVRLQGTVRCNPVNAPPDCRLPEKL